MAFGVRGILSTARYSFVGGSPLFFPGMLREEKFVAKRDGSDPEVDCLFSVSGFCNVFIIHNHHLDLGWHSDILAAQVQQQTGRQGLDGKFSVGHHFDF